MGWGLLNMSFMHFWTFTAISKIIAIFFFSELGPNFKCQGKFIPWRVNFQLHFIGKVIPVFWKLSLGSFYRYLGTTM